MDGIRVIRVNSNSSWDRFQGERWILNQSNHSNFRSEKSFRDVDGDSSLDSLIFGARETRVRSKDEFSQ